MNLKLGNLVLVKSRCLEGKGGRCKDRWEERDLGGGASKLGWHQCSTYESDKPMQTVMSPPQKLTSSHHIRDWHSLVYGQPSYMGQVYQPTSVGDEKRGCHKRKVVSWSPNNLPVKLPRHGKIGMLWLLLWTSTGASTLRMDEDHR